MKQGDTYVGYCNVCKEATTQKIVKDLSGTPGYYESTVGAPVDMKRVICEKCGYTHEASFGNGR